MATEQTPALRISDAERERTVKALGEHHAVGRLTYEEFVDRMDQAYEARTHRQLEALTSTCRRRLPWPFRSRGGSGAGSSR